MPEATDLQLTIDRALPAPLYHQVARELEAAIEDGRLARGSLLGSELHLAERWGVSRLTLRRAIAELVEAGLLVRRPGIGTRVVSDAVPEPIRLGSSFDELLAHGRSPRTTVLAFEHVAVDDEVADQLHLDRGTTVTYVERCRHANGKRLAMLRNWLPVTLMENIGVEDLIDGGLYQQLRRNNVRPHSATRRVQATVAGPVDAAMLGQPVGSPLLEVETVTQDNRGIRITVCRQVSVGSDYVLELTEVSP